MHPDLTPHLHSPECNKLIADLKLCHETYTFRKFIGICNDIDREVTNCLRKERAANQAENRRKALEKQERVRQQMLK